jgi:DNA-binding NtrC family response regulator
MPHICHSFVGHPVDAPAFQRVAGPDLAPHPRSGTEVGRGLMKVLVVDDEEFQVETIRIGLDLYGYECLTALNACQAMEVLNGAGGDAVCLLITDMTMPGKSGLELIHIVRYLKPELPIIVITGLTTTSNIEEVQRMDIPVLQKPFDPDTLDATIKRAIRSVPGGETR